MISSNLLTFDNVFVFPAKLSCILVPLLPFRNSSSELRGRLPGLCVCQSLSPVQLFATPWTLLHQAPLSRELSRQEYLNELSFPSPGDLPDSGIEPRSPALQADSLPSELLGIWHPYHSYNSCDSLISISLSEENISFIWT